MFCKLSLKKIKNMKKLLLSFFLLGIIISSARAQVVPGEKQVPKVVLDKFKADFPNQKVKRWEVKHWKPKHYEAVFVYNNMPTRARYFDSGEAYLVSHTYNANQLPSTVSAATLAAFPGFKLDWAHEIKNKKNNTDVFLLHLSKPGHILKVFVNADGTVFTGKDEDFKGMDENNDANN